MRIPLSARIGLYIILGGLIFDVIDHYAGGYEDLLPGIGIFSVILVPLGLVLVVGTAFFKLLEWRRLRSRWIPITPPGLPQAELQLGTGNLTFDPQKLQVFQSDSGFAIAAVATALIIVGLISPPLFRRWMATRTFIALDMPVSLARGHIRTGDFYINVQQVYYVQIRVDSAFRHNPECRFLVPDSLLHTRSTLFRDGQKLGEGEGTDALFAYFYPDKKGHYSLDVEVSSDAGCLDTWHPRIVVQTSSDDYDDFYQIIWILSFALVLAGIGLVARCIGTEIGRRLTRAQRAGSYDSINRTYYPRTQKLLPNRFSGLPPFGLVAVVISFVFLLSVWLPMSLRRVSKGLYVFVLKPGVPAPGIDRWTQPLIVRIRDVGVQEPPHLYVNSTAVSWDRLRYALKLGLSRRSEWVVYVAADPNVPWGDALQVMDISRGLHAKVILLTPNTDFEQP